MGGWASDKRNFSGNFYRQLSRSVSIRCPALNNFYNSHRQLTVGVRKKTTLSVPYSFSNKAVDAG